MTEAVPELIRWPEIRVRLADIKPWLNNPKHIRKAEALRLLEYIGKIGQFQALAVGPWVETPEWKYVDLYDGHQRYDVLKAAYGLNIAVDVKQSPRALDENERRELVVKAHIGTTGHFEPNKLLSFPVPELVAYGIDDTYLKG